MESGKLKMETADVSHEGTKARRFFEKNHFQRLPFPRKAAECRQAREDIFFAVKPPLRSLRFFAALRGNGSLGTGGRICASS